MLDHTTVNTTVVQRPSRWHVPTLWAVAGYADRGDRVRRFLALIARPGIVSDTDPPVACDLLAPPRPVWGRPALAASGIVIAVGGVVAARTMPLWLAVVMVFAVFASSVLLLFRALSPSQLPPGHVVLVDVAAARRGSGVARSVLAQLLDALDRPTYLEVRHDAPGLIRMYETLGFEHHRRVGDHIAMVRPGTSTDPYEGSVVGVMPRWFWPTRTDVTVGISAAVAMLVLHWPGTWSRHVLVAAAAFIVATAASTDWRVQRIPNVLTLAGIIPILWIATGTRTVTDALIGAAITAGPLLAAHLATATRTPGLGDVKLAAIAGATVGLFDPTTAPLAVLFMTLLGGAGFGAIWQRTTGRRGFPLGPAIATATLAMLTIEGLTLRGAL